MSDKIQKLREASKKLEDAAKLREFADRTQLRSGRDFTQWFGNTTAFFSDGEAEAAISAAMRAKASALEEDAQAILDGLARGNAIASGSAKLSGLVAEMEPVIPTENFADAV